MDWIHLAALLVCSQQHFKWSIRQKLDLISENTSTTTTTKLAEDFKWVKNRFSELNPIENTESIIYFERRSGFVKTTEFLLDPSHVAAPTKSYFCHEIKFQIQQNLTIFYRFHKEAGKNGFMRKVLMYQKSFLTSDMIPGGAFYHQTISLIFIGFLWFSKFLVISVRLLFLVSFSDDFSRIFISTSFVKKERWNHEK